MELLRDFNYKKTTVSNTHTLQLCNGTKPHTGQRHSMHCTCNTLYERHLQMPGLYHGVLRVA